MSCRHLKELSKKRWVNPIFLSSMCVCSPGCTPANEQRLVAEKGLLSYADAQAMLSAPATVLPLLLRLLSTRLLTGKGLVKIQASRPCACACAHVMHMHNTALEVQCSQYRRKPVSVANPACAGVIIRQNMWSGHTHQQVLVEGRVQLMLRSLVLVHLA